MPIYEYRCVDCGRLNSVLVRSFSETPSPKCGRCGGANLRKLISRFSTVKSEDARLDDLADPSHYSDLDENDPKSIARWARKMGGELGEDLGPEFDQAIDELESGKMPDDLGPDGGPGADVGGDDAGADGL
jgi:putative FmdB family regulatory protein